MNYRQTVKDNSVLFLPMAISLKKKKIFAIFLKKMSSFWQFFDIQMAIFRRVRFGIRWIAKKHIFEHHCCCSQQKAEAGGFVVQGYNCGNILRNPAFPHVIVTFDNVISLLKYVVDDTFSMLFSKKNIVILKIFYIFVFNPHL